MTKARVLRHSISGLAAVGLLWSSSARAADDTDPHKGQYTLTEALKGVPSPAKGPLTASIETSQGKLTCELFEKQAPVTVANFVGLARGTRAWQDPKTNKWVKKPFYDGLIFHRVIPGFMIQGGDPLGIGIGNPGYKFADEIVPELKFDKPGILAMANAGPATNGSQFFITDGPTEHLNGHHTIFGACEPVSVVSAIAGVPRGPNDKPATDVVIKKVKIARSKPAKAADAKGEVKAKAEGKTDAKAVEAKPATP